MTYVVAYDFSTAKVTPSPFFENTVCHPLLPLSVVVLVPIKTVSTTMELLKDFFLIYFGFIFFQFRDGPLITAMNVITTEYPQYFAKIITKSIVSNFKPCVI